MLDQERLPDIITTMNVPKTALFSDLAVLIALIIFLICHAVAPFWYSHRYHPDMYWLRRLWTGNIVLAISAILSIIFLIRICRLKNPDLFHEHQHADQASQQGSAQRSKKITRYDVLLASNAVAVATVFSWIIVKWCTLKAIVEWQLIEMKLGRMTPGAGYFFALIGVGLIYLLMLLVVPFVFTIAMAPTIRLLALGVEAKDKKVVWLQDRLLVHKAGRIALD